MAKMAYDPSNRDYRVMYVTNASDDALFIPGNQSQGDNPDSGTTAQRLADCQELVGVQKTDSSKQVGQACKPGGSDW